MILQLSIQKSRHLNDSLALCISDVFHSADHLIAGLLVLDFLRPQFFFHAKVFFLRFLHLGEGGIVRQSSTIELLAGILDLQSDTGVN